MRYLHPVTVHEQYVASGTYSLRTDAAAGPVLVEEWSIHQQPDGAHFVRVDREDPAKHAVWLAEGWRSPAGDGGQLERYDILAYRTDQQPVMRLRASYSLFPDLVEVGRTIGDSPREYVELTPTNYVFDPGSFVFWGAVASDMLCGDREHVIGICDDSSSPDVLLPHTRAMSAVLVGEDRVELGGREHEARIVELRRQGVPDIQRLWIDANDVVLRAETHREGRVVAHIALSNYGRRAY